jgi:glycolate oxidase iron-sulfur subunit
MPEPITLLQTPAYQRMLDQCIHCGLCLEACPTYAVYATEMDGPRGRIQLMGAVSRGRLPLSDDDVATHIDRCLGCRACETACPSGVQYGALWDGMQQALAEQHAPGLAERAVRWLALRQLMAHPGRLRALGAAMWLYQRSGLQRVARRMGLVPPPLRAMEAILPPIQPAWRDTRRGPRAGASRGRVAFLQGCVQDAFLAGVNAASVRVLRRNGYEVVFPEGQTCCGAAMHHTGEVELARDLARRNINACLALDVDAIVSNAGGCGLELKEYPHLLRDDPFYGPRAAEFAAKVRDISELLAEGGIEPPPGSVPARAVYVDSCHLRHGQRVVRQPRELLRQVAGLELVELQRPDRCCGSAGVYNITHPEAAQAILNDKIADVAAAGANLVVVSNTGCHFQMIAGVRQAGLNARVMHVVEVLDEAYAD